MSATLSKIVLVEDDPDIQEIAIMALEDFGGYNVTACSSGPEALEKVPAVSPDLILLDVMMPGMDGPTTLQNIRRMPDIASTPVIFLTARSQPHEVEEYMKLGAVDVIKKPFDPVELCQQIEDIWSKCQDG
ncbi:MAG: response regulator [Rhodospirillales bacterium]|nr:response regulator [Rhodospirillales bacterium]